MIKLEDTKWCGVAVVRNLNTVGHQTHSIVEIAAARYGRTFATFAPQHYRIEQWTGRLILRWRKRERGRLIIV